MRATVLAVSLLVACGAAPKSAPGALKVGVATVALDAPVGMPMGGYSRGQLKGQPGDPGSPWVDSFPATRGLQSIPTARAIALANDKSTLVVVRVDLGLVTSSLRWRAQWALKDLGHEVPLLVEATHTHHGPARYFRPAPIDGANPFDPTASSLDTFDQEAEDKLGTSIAVAAKQALDGLVPAAMGIAVADGGAFNKDRRCENDDLYGPNFKDSDLTVVRFDAVDSVGQPTRPLTGFIHFAMHGTVLDRDNPLFTNDAPGAMELMASDAVGVPLLYLQGSAGDIAPDTRSVGHDEFQSLEQLGHAAAPVVADAFARAAPTKAGSTPIDIYETFFLTTRDALGYPRGEYFENGGIGCGLGGAACRPVRELALSEVICVPLKRRPYMFSSVMLARVGPLALAALPGEPTTAIGLKVKEELKGLAGSQAQLVVGYANDHAGYLLERPDWLRMGYEPSVSPWGYRFGEFLLQTVKSTVSKLGSQAPKMPEPERLPAATPRIAESSRVAAGPLGEVGAVARLGVAVFRFHGGDATLGTPQLRLEREGASGFAPVMASALRPAGVGLELLLRYAPTPTYLVQPSGARDHVWQVEFEVPADTELGRYRFVATGKQTIDGNRREYEVASQPFSVGPATSMGSAVRSRFLADGRMALSLLFPPHPVVKENGAVVRGYRMLDPLTDPRIGSRAQGGSFELEVKAAGAPQATAVRFAWSADEGAYLGVVPAGAASYDVSAPPMGLRDGAGNTNAQPLMTTVLR
jgi:hypothetical protein